MSKREFQWPIKMGKILSAAGEFPFQLGSEPVHMERHEQQTIFPGKVFFECCAQL